MITEIIKKLETVTGLPVEPFGTGAIKDCICYRWIPSSSDGCISQYRLELRIICKTINTAQQVSKQIKGALLNIGDTAKLDGVLEVTQNGGGSLQDFGTQTIHTLLFFNVKEREVI